MSDKPEDLAAQLAAARARIAELEQEIEASRTMARVLTQSGENVAFKPGGAGVGHAFVLVIGVLTGMVLAVGVMVMRTPPAYGPPEPVAAVVPKSVDAGVPAAVVVTVRDAGAAVVDAGAAPAPAGAKPAAVNATPDDTATLNLTASSEAAVFVDGKRAGLTPVRGYAVKPGLHVIKFVCMSAGGVAGERQVNVPAYAEVDVEQTCE